MTIMTKQSGLVNIFDITYPCYVSSIPVDSKRVIYIPEQSKYQFLDIIDDWVIEGYRTNEKIYLCDCLPIQDWNRKKSNIPFSQRIRYVRNLVNSVIGNYSKVSDLPTQLIDNPLEMTNYIKEALTTEIKTIRILDRDKNYVFGECENNEYLELEI
jgi:hypothetical protein